MSGSTSPDTTYFKLEIIAKTNETEVWLGDDGGSLVVKEVGQLEELLLPGDYVVEFGLGTPCYAVPLHGDARYTQSELELAGPCERPKFNVPEDLPLDVAAEESPVLREILRRIDPRRS